MYDSMVTAMGKYRIPLVACALFAAACVLTFTQDAEPEALRDLKTVSIGFAMDNISAHRADLRAGLNLEQFVSLGILWNMGFAGEGDEPATELAVGVWTDAKLLSEDNNLPVTFVVRGEFLKTRFLSAYLDDNDLVKSGTGYRIGAAVSRKFTISDTSGLNVALDGRYEFDTYTLEAAAGSQTTIETQITPSTDYFYGLAVEYEMRVAGNMALAFGLQLYLNSDLHIFYGPRFSFITW